MVGRTAEAARLTALWERAAAGGGEGGGSAVAVVRGMSRIGKTKFVLETLKEKGAVAFFFVSRNHFLDVLLTHWRASLSEAVGVPTGEDAEGSGAVTRPIGKAGLDEWAAFWEEAFATVAAHARASSRPVAILLDGADTAEKCWPGAIERLRAVWERSERSIRAEGDGRAPGIFLVLTETVVRDPQEPPLSTVPAWNDRVAAPVPVTDRFPAAERIDLRPWPPEVLRAVLSAFNPRATDEDFLALWAVSGGRPDVAAAILLRGARTKDDVFFALTEPRRGFRIDSELRELRLFSDALGQHVRDVSGTAWEIVRSAAELRIREAPGERGGLRSARRSDLAKDFRADVSGELWRLERGGMLRRVMPVAANGLRRPGVRFRLGDPVLEFCRAFIAPRIGAVELERHAELAAGLRAWWPAWRGCALEDLWAEELRRAGFPVTGPWWGPKGEHPIDLVALDPEGRRAVLADVGRGEGARKSLSERAEAFFAANPDVRGWAVWMGQLEECPVWERVGR